MLLLKLQTALLAAVCSATRQHIMLVLLTLSCFTAVALVFALLQDLKKSILLLSKGLTQLMVLTAAQCCVWRNPIGMY